MSTTETEILTVQPYGYGQTRPEPYEVLDADGTPIPKGAYVQVVKETSFLHEGEIIRVRGAQHGDNGLGENWASLQIETSRGSSTGINADQVRVTDADDPDVETQFRLTFLLHQLGTVEGNIASLVGRRAELRYAINQIDSGLLS